VNADGTLANVGTPRQFKIVKMNSEISNISQPKIQTNPHPQIKIVNNDGTVTSISGQVKVISSTQLSQAGET
jgi:hypothetical protein